MHVTSRGDVEDWLGNDAVEHDGTTLLRVLQRLDEFADRDFRDDGVSFIKEAGGRRPSELDEHLPVLLELRVQHLRRGRQRDGGHFPEFPRFGPRLRPWFRSRLGATVGPALRRGGGGGVGPTGFGVPLFHPAPRARPFPILTAAGRWFFAASY